MKFFRHFLFLTFSLVLLNSCAKESITITTNGHIQLNNMAVGQQSKYVGFGSRTPWSESDTAYKPMNDTLTLTIIEKDDTGFKIKEERTDLNYKPYYYYFSIKGDSLLIKPSQTSYINSSIFTEDTKSFILKNNGLTQFSVNRWSVLKDVSFETKFGILKEVSILNKKYDTALVYYNPNAMIYDGQAFTRIYTPDNGFLCFQALGGLLPIGNIFYLIP